jgi:sterol desaturase/sphingolipid hydroxylase (fatty acid hydroxylase superfamily)
MDYDMAAASRLFLMVFPVLVLAGVIEGLFYQRLRQQPFSWKASLASLGVAVGHRLAGLALGGIVLTQFQWLHAHRLLDIPMDNGFGLAALFIGSEFFYYWQHRLSHEIRWLWATHAVHHSAEQLSLSAAYRLGWTGAISGVAVLFAPLVLIGFPPKAVFIMLGVNLLYQFWLHTELLPRLGWFDRVFNSPSNHRVHHARNREYLDKNYGGILMIFDQLFGTYAPERLDLTIKYGLVGHAPSHNPFVLALGEWYAIGRDVLRAKNWRDRYGFVFGRPGWRPKNS